MNLSIRKQQWLVLEQEIKGVECLSLLHQLQSEHAQFQEYETWGSVFEAMRSRGPDDFGKSDQILLPILLAIQSSGNPNWQTITLVMFKRALNTIWRQRSRFEFDPDEVWQQVLEIFLSVIKQLDTNVRQFKFASKIVNDTRHRAYEYFRGEWTHRGREEATTFDKLLDLEARNIKERAPEEASSGVERAITHLKEFKEQGRLDEAEYQILVDSRILGYSIRDLAKNSTETYEALKKRRQRAESHLRETVVLAEA